MRNCKKKIVNKHVPKTFYVFEKNIDVTNCITDTDKHDATK